MDSRRDGPWGPKKPPYDPAQDGRGPDGYKPWDRRTVAICVLGGALIALLGWVVLG